MYHIHRLALSGYETLANALGVNPYKLLTQAGINPVQLREPNDYLPFTGVANVLELTAQASGEPLFGTRLATIQGFQLSGDLGISAIQQPTILAALNYVRGHGNLMAEGMRMKYAQHGLMAELTIAFDFDGDYGLQQVTQLNVVKLYELIKYLTQTDDHQLTVHLRQAMPEGILWQWRQLENYVVFDSAIDGIRFPANWLQKPPHTDTQVLRNILMDRVQQLQSKYPNKLETRISHTIAKLLPSSECSIELVATALELHPRTLQQRLQQVGLTYSRLLQQTRLHIAKQKLQESDMSITELALNLGYADIAIFSRNFKKWTGHTPSQFRAQKHPQAVNLPL